MKILRIVYDWPPPWSGLAPNPYEVTNAQVKAGHEVTIFCGRWPNAGKVVQLPGVKIHAFWREPLPGTVSFTTSVFMFLYYLYWRTKNKVDVIHTHGHFGIWIYLYRLLLLKLDKNNDELDTPLVAHFHNTVQGRWEALKSKGVDLKKVSIYIAWPMEKLANILAVKTANALIFVSEDNKNDAIKYYKADPAKCYVVENGVNAHSFASVGIEEREKTRKELTFEPYDKVILNLGMLLERKNIHLIIEALAYLPSHYKLLLVGPGDPDYLFRLEKLIDEKKVKSRVVMTGATPHPEVPIAFQACDIFVLPSSFEGLPKVALESLACGKQTLVSGFKINEQIDGLYYLENLDPKYIAERIKDLVENPKPVDAVKIGSRYSWNQKALQIEQIYKKVLN